MSNENKSCQIIPIISVQCPFDCSAKAMLLSICKRVDEMLDTNYYEMQIRSRAATNIMIHSVSQILLNHCAVLIIDEIQNLVKHRAGMQLVGMLTELLNDSGVSIVMVGTPEVESFFSSVDYLARRTVGLRFDKCSYDDYFFKLCTELWAYIYVKKESVLTDGLLHYLYEHTGGVLSHLVFLFHTAQEISILDGREEITLEVLEESYQNMRMLHTHIDPSVIKGKELKEKALRVNTSKKKNQAQEVLKQATSLEQMNGNDDVVSDALLTGTTIDDVVIHPVNKGSLKEWSFLECSSQAKKQNRDIVEILLGNVSVTELVG